MLRWGWDEDEEVAGPVMGAEEVGGEVGGADATARAVMAAPM